MTTTESDELKRHVSELRNEMLKLAEQAEIVDARLRRMRNEIDDIHDRLNHQRVP